MLNTLFELSLFGGQLSRNLEAVVRRTALSFRVDDCQHMAIHHQIRIV